MASDTIDSGEGELPAERQPHFEGKARNAYRGPTTPAHQRSPIAM